MHNVLIIDMHFMFLVYFVVHAHNCSLIIDMHNKIKISIIIIDMHNDYGHAQFLKLLYRHL